MNKELKINKYILIYIFIIFNTCDKKMNIHK